MKNETDDKPHQMAFADIHVASVKQRTSICQDQNITISVVFLLPACKTSV